MSTPEDILQIMSIISAAYPNFKGSEFTAEVYFRTLQDIPANLLKAATLQAISEPGRQFAPSIGELRGTVLTLSRIANNTPTSFEAWQEVQQQLLVNGGDFGKPVWSHPLVEKTVRALGWRNLRLSQDSTADRARFVQAYDQFQSKFELEEIMVPEVKAYISETQTGIKMLTDKMNVRNDKTLPHPAETWEPE